MLVLQYSGSFYTHTQEFDHKNLRAFRNHPKVVLHEIDGPSNQMKGVKWIMLKDRNIFSISGFHCDNIVFLGGNGNVIDYHGLKFCVKPNSF